MLLYDEIRKGIVGDLTTFSLSPSHPIQPPGREHREASDSPTFLEGHPCYTRSAKVSVLS
jgi:hypothetical protein